jgi:hypothetical protein
VGRRQGAVGPRQRAVALGRAAVGLARAAVGLARAAEGRRWPAAGTPRRRARMPWRPTSPRRPVLPRLQAVQNSPQVAPNRPQVSAWQRPLDLNSRFPQPAVRKPGSAPARWEPESSGVAWWRPGRPADSSSDRQHRHLASACAGPCDPSAWRAGWRDAARGARPAARPPKEAVAGIPRPGAAGGQQTSTSPFQGHT